MNPQVAIKRNEIARAMTLGSAPRVIPQQPQMMGSYAPAAVTAPKPVAYSEPGFGYGERQTPFEEIGTALGRRR